MSIKSEINYDGIKTLADEAIVEVVKNYDVYGDDNQANYETIEAYQEELIVRYDKLAKSIAYKYRNTNSSVTMDDLCQIARIAVLDAAKKFKSTSDNRFKPYCLKVVESKIRDEAIYKSRTISIPENKIKLNRKIKNKRAMLVNINGIEPTVEEIAIELNISPETIVETEGYFGNIENYDNKIDSESGACFKDLIEDVNQLDPETNLVCYSAESIIDKGLTTLTYEEEIVIRGRHGFNGKISTLQELSDKLGCSLSKVNSLEESGLDKLNTYLHKYGVI